MRATFQNLFANFDMLVFVRTLGSHARAAFRWMLILLPMAPAVALTSAAFLWSRDVVTRRKQTGELF